MKKLQARDVPDDLYDRVAAAAARNARSMEGQVRHTIAEAHPPVTEEASPVSLREAWQQDAGQRIRWVFDRLRDDGWFRYGEASDPASLARRIGEDSPSTLLDCLDGISGPTFAMADRMERALSCRADWIMSGSGAPFRCESLSSRYHEFFESLLDENGQLLPDTALHFVRICADNHNDGTLLVLVRRGVTWQCRFEHSLFLLKDGMGSGGRGNLFRFMAYVKTHLAKVPYKSWLYRNKNEAQPEISYHHPEHFIQDLTLSEHSDWLYRMLNGEAPKGWTMAFSMELGQLETLPHGRMDDVPNVSASQDFSYINPSYIRRLAEMLSQFGIVCDYWKDLAAEYVRQTPRGFSSDETINLVMRRFHLHDSQQSLHGGTPESASRRTELRAALQKELDFSPENATKLIEDISVRFQTASDFIRSLAERHIHCNDAGQFERQVDSIAVVDSPDMNPFAQKLAATAEKTGFIYADGRRTMDSTTAAELHQLLTRDFRFTDAAAGQFIAQLRTGNP